MIDKMKLTLVFMVVVVTIITCVNPVFPHEQLLQHIGTFLLLTPLVYDVFARKSIPKVQEKAK